METTVYLGLGSNLGDRAGAIGAAVGRLVGEGILRDIRMSPIYETDAVAAEAQPPYLNAVVRGRTDLGAAELLAGCLAIEGELGRVRPPGVVKAPRSIDIDVLLFGDAIIDGPELKVPHPAMAARAFVLIPLADVAAPGLAHPITGAPLTVARPSPSVRRFG